MSGEVEDSEHEAEDVVAQQSQLSEILTNPFRTAQGIIEYSLAWFYTRHLSALLGFLPALLIVLPLTGLALYGWSMDRDTLVTRYAKWSDAELNAGDKKADETANPQAHALMQVEGVSKFGELLLNRLLQLEKSDTRSRFLVAQQIGNRGRRGQARQLMRQIAPERNNGFAPAHAWLAIDRILQGPLRDKASETVLLNDLEVAASWSGTGTRLREILANLLENTGRIGDAIKVLQATAEMDANVWVRVVEVALKNGRKQPAEDASKKAKAIFTQKMVEQTATEMDFINMARLWALEQNPDEAIKQTLVGLQLLPESRNLRLVLSECYRVKFLTTLKETQEGFQCNMEYLNEALKADPTNPNVSEEVAKLMARGGDVSPTLKLAMEQQLADGKATTMTHLMLATHWLKKSDFARAIPHLEVANRKSPNMPVVLNNLALALVRLSPDNVNSAKDLIDQAIKYNRPHAELFDSQGEIRMLAGDYVGAVESLETAIGLDDQRLNTRKRLIEAYEKAGLKDMIEIQMQKIREIEALQGASEGQNKSPAAPAQPHSNATPETAPSTSPETSPSQQ
jgi:tetratricopeptide (TPR) repeat protein